MTKPPFSNAQKAPQTSKKPHKVTQHGQSRIDNYHWLRDENWQEVLQAPEKLRQDIREHLDLENQYYETATDHLTPLRDKLFEEMRGRIKEDDSTVPAPDGAYAYGSRFREGGNYPIFTRTAREGGEETILFDGDIEGKGEDFFDIASVSHSPDHKLIAYGIDRLGSEYFDIRIRDINTGNEYEETVSKSDGTGVWAMDSQSFYYVERDDHQRPKWVKRHFIGTHPNTDELIYEEKDDSFFLSVGKSQSNDYIFISVSNGSSSEEHFIRANAPKGSKPKCIAPRIDDELYDTDHHGDYFYIRTNGDHAVDFKIIRTPVDTPDRKYWRDWLGHDAGTFVIAILPLKNHFIRLVRMNALPQIIISSYDRDEGRANEQAITFDEDAYSLGLTGNLEFETDIIRFAYSSPTTPQQIFDYHLATHERSLRKTQEIPSGHDSSLYETKRLFITASDNEKIPVTLLKLKSTPVDGTAPLMLYGYGAYGITIPASFSSAVLSLVDRGVVYATAHIRGGAAKGRQWYLDGKMEKKKNSFTDFAAVAMNLQAKGYGKSGETVIYGGSAGGLLVGATMNLHPSLFGGAIGAVPFIDVLNTISDENLPLTPPEWVEWGDPIKDPKAFETIAAYSPYENIKTDQAYPPILATGGLADYRVTYWEPAKWVARLREDNPGGPFFLKMNMEAGHGGSAARFERLKERAHDYAFALEIFDLADQKPIAHKTD